jgi:hypothetical protein
MDPVCLLLPHATDGPLSLMAVFFCGCYWNYDGDHIRQQMAN